MIEPSADARVFARVCRDNFDALLAEGFDEEQAMVLLINLILVNAPERPV